MIEYNWRQHNWEDLTCSHDQWEHQRAEVLYCHKDEYLADRACKWQQSNMMSYTGMFGQEIQSFSQLRIRPQTHKCKQARIQIGYEHQRYAWHRIGFDKFVLPSAGKTISYQVEQET
jgi:hypothetical protein